MKTGKDIPDFSHVDHWVFDLDNTLYPADCNLFAQVDIRMRDFIVDLLAVDEDEARRLQKGYFLSHGTTLKGLIDNHGIRPEDFLRYVHDIDVSPVPPNPDLAEILHNLPGRNLIFTNGSVAHAENVMRRLGIADCFDGIFDIVHSDFVPKKHVEPYHAFLEKHDVDPTRAAMFEDMARNLVPAHAVGMTTVWIPGNTDWSYTDSDGDHIHHTTDNLTEFLREISTGLA